MSISSNRRYPDRKLRSTTCIRSALVICLDVFIAVFWSDVLSMFAHRKSKVPWLRISLDNHQFEIVGP